MKPFAVLFDMDGLMLDTERMARKAWTHALADQGYALDETQYMNLLGRTSLDAKNILSELFGPELPFQQIYELRQSYYDHDIATNGIPIKHGLLDLLDFLEAHDIPKAVASSAPGWFAEIKLERAGIINRFQAVVCGDQVKRGKPAPDVFLEAANQLHYPPRICVVLEDSEAGIMAAHEAGALPLMVPDLKPPSPEVIALAHGIYPSLQAVIPVLEDFLREGLPVL